LKKIAIINQPINNRGDQAAHKAFVNILLDYNIKPSVLFFGLDKQYVKPFIEGIENVDYYCYKKPLKIVSFILKKILLFCPALFNLTHLIPSYKKYVNKLKKADMVVMAPGGANIGIYKSWSTLYHLYIALKYSKKVAIWGRSIGPFSDKTKEDIVFKNKSREILNNIDFISLRDKISQEAASSLNINYVKTTDTAFLFDPGIDLPKNLKYLEDEDYIVFVPHKLSFWHPFFKKIKQKKLDDLFLKIIKNAHSKGYKVVMLPQLFNHGGEGDYYYFKHLKEKSISLDVDIISEKYDSDIQQVIVKNSKALIGARYHSIIFAINNCTPFISLSYEPKMKGILKSLELEEYSLDLKAIVENEDDNKVFDLLNEILKNNDKIIKNISEKKNLARTIALRSFNKFLEYSQE
jgi:colanic acid/amylovoran biosynthesis protein